jgi:cyclohexanecarboxyl-CoA dehydrogenase
MAEFGFTEAQEMFRTMARDFTRRELFPGAKERAKLNRIRAEIMNELADVGFLGLRTPEEYGGQMSDWVTGGIACEETAKADLGASMAILFASFAGEALALCGEEVRAEWMPLCAKEGKIMALCVTEPDTGSDAAAIKARAVRDGDYYVLNGEKTSATFGMQADVAAIWTKTDPAAPGVRGVTAFVVPMNVAGIERIPFADLGWRTMERSSIAMNNVRIPAKYRISDEGQGFYKVMGVFDWIRLFLCLQVLALGQQSVNEATDYAKERKAFNRPIAKFEAVSFRLVDSLAKIEAAKLLTYKALWMLDHGMKATRETAMAKSISPQIGIEACNNAMLTFGHVGYSSEYVVEQRLRDAYGFEFADGTADIQRVVMVRDFIGKEYRAYA